MRDIREIYRKLLLPSDDLIADISKLDGDIIILGAGGKIGPALSKLSKEAIDKTGIKKKIIAVSRFTDRDKINELNELGIETYNADLLEDDQLQSLPDVKNVLYLAGTKFGTSGNESFTWAMNSYLPGRVAQKYKNSNIVAFSTGNVYHLTSVDSGGATENRVARPVGEYAQSCLGRERLFEYYAKKNNTPVLIFRLNYANDVSYGVLLEIAQSVKSGKAIDLNMGYVNVIWQGDANEIALRSLLHCEVPAKILNVTGPEIISVRWLANEFGKMFKTEPVLINDEQPTALLSNASEAFRLFGYPKVSLNKMMEVIAEWIKQDGKILNKPTHFQEREGQF